MDKAMETQARINELEGNVKIAARWIDAVERSTFHGTYAMDIGMLIGFLKEQHAKNKSDLAKVLDEVKYLASEFKKSQTDKVPA